MTENTQVNFMAAVALCFAILTVATFLVGGPTTEAFLVALLAAVFHVHFEVLKTKHALRQEKFEGERLRLVEVRAKSLVENSDLDSGMHYGYVGAEDLEGLKNAVNDGY